MTTVIIVGDGPAGLSAGLFLSKNQHSPIIVGKDESSLHRGYLYNYPGVVQLDGSEFIENARSQCEYFGARFETGTVGEISTTDEERYSVETESGESFVGKYIIVCGPSSQIFSDDLPIQSDENNKIEVDSNYETNIQNIFAAGKSTPSNKNQVAISVGQGCHAALEVLERETGQEVHDYDSRAITHLTETGPDEARWL